MITNELRKELHSLIGQENGRRKPVVRRSLRAEWIYVTDLPLVTGEKQLESICEQLHKADWESMTEGYWMHLRKEIHEPPEGWYEGEFGPEAGCCRSLLKRHPGSQGGFDQRIEYALIRAGEEGADAYEAACRLLHQNWARRLREKQKLPDVSLQFFEGGKQNADQTHWPCGVLDGNGERSTDCDRSL